VQQNSHLTLIDDDGCDDIHAYNAELKQRGAPKWLDIAWLFSGCYLYRRLQSFFKSSNHWSSYDVFARSKLSGLKSSRPAILELAAQYKTIVSNFQSSHKPQNDEIQTHSEQAEEILFIEIAEICLWGNKTDLSLHTNLTEEEIQNLQGAKVRKASEKKILINDLSKAFAVLNKTLQEGKIERRVDIVLDNAGFELFVDLIFAGYLLITGLATTVVLHPKDFPWYVSDVIPKDFTDLLNALQNAPVFFGSAHRENALSQVEVDNLSFLFESWSSFHAEGKLVVRPNNFWTNGGSYWRLPGTAPNLYEDLKQSELVMFKGDLNYRKLIADVCILSRGYIPLLIYIRPTGPQLSLSPKLLGHSDLAPDFGSLRCGRAKLMLYVVCLRVRMKN
jgi:hypothetical protein